MLIFEVCNCLLKCFEEWEWEWWRLRLWLQTKTSEAGLSLPSFNLFSSCDRKRHCHTRLDTDCHSFFLVFFCFFFSFLPLLVSHPLSHFLPLISFSSCLLLLHLFFHWTCSGVKEDIQREVLMASIATRSTFNFCQNQKKRIFISQEEKTKDHRWWWWWQSLKTLNLFRFPIFHPTALTSFLHFLYCLFS